MVHPQAREYNRPQSRIRPSHCQWQLVGSATDHQPLTTDRSEIPLISERQADARRVGEPGRLADDVPAKLAFDARAAAE